MVFSSYLFLFGFLPVALAIYYGSPRRLRQLVLTLVSYVFYGWGNPIFCLLMFATTLVDYTAARLLVRGDDSSGKTSRLPVGGPRTRQQKMILAASIAANLGSLGFFKYWNFGVDTYNALMAQLGVPSPTYENLIRVVLPLGISFYTFQSLSYTIDVYRGHVQPLRSFTRFACYVSMFPQLVAGPIVRFQDIAEDLLGRTHTLEKFSRGIAFFCLGLSKKVLLANPCGQVADRVFDAESVGTADAWLGMFAYSFQIYFDFSGYSDMAIGLGLMLGFRFAKNFDSPYQSTSITEFWRRWHISLSTWLRDYLYIPLGGNRLGGLRTSVNIMLVMLLGGLWHGAAWNFVLWGAIHGGWLVSERTLGPRLNMAVIPKWLRIWLTFLGVSLAWIPFRASDASQSIQYAQSLLGFAQTEPASAIINGLIWQPFYLTVLGMAAAVVWGCPQTWNWTMRLSPLRAVVVLGLFWLSVATLTVQEFNPFIYFIF